MCGRVDVDHDLVAIASRCSLHSACDRRFREREEAVGSVGGGGYAAEV